MPDRSDPWLVLSRLVGVLPLPDGRLVAAHILGRCWAVGDVTIASLLEWFAVPRHPNALREPADVPHELLDRVLAQLRGAGILRDAGSNEADRIRTFYRGRLREPQRAAADAVRASAAPPRWLVTDGGVAPEALTCATDPDAVLGLSPALATLSLDGDEMLVTHPLHTPMHMAGALWRLAKLFDRPTTVKDALAGFSRAGLDEGQALAVCGFLRRAFLLWPSHDAETARAAEIVGPDDLSSLRVEHPAVSRWRQKFAPYTVADASRCDAAGVVALIGPCHLQLAAEALQVLAEREGIHLDVAGMLDPGDPRLHDARWSAVVLSATQYAASLYEAIAAEDRQAVERLARSVEAHIDEAVDRIRALTPAPLIVTSISPPGLPPAGAESAFWHASAAVLARLNAAVASRLATLPDAWLLDESRLAAATSPGIYWDDEFNALPHHSAVSSWSWLVTKSEVVAAGDAGHASVVPVADAAQIDPAVVLASGILQIVKRRYVERPVRLIVFEPNDLLWRGRLQDRVAAYPTPPHFYADVEDYLYAGIHEAMSVLRRRGVLLACASSCPAEQILARWTSPSPLQHLVRCDDLIAVEGGGSWPDRLSRLLTRLSIGEEDVLVVAFPPPELPAFRGRVYHGAPFGLRRFLLTAPPLNPLPEPSVAATRAEADSACAHPAADPESGAEPAALEEEVHRTIAAVLGVSIEAVRRSEDLRLLGADSLGAVEFISALENRFGVLFEDHQKVAPVVFVPAMLGAAVRDALRHQRLHRAPSRRPAPDDCYGNLSYDAWSAGNLASLLARHIEQPAVPWIFKVVGSAAPFDAEFLSWKKVGTLARAYAAAYAATGASPGDRVGIAIRHGTSLIGAFAGAILGRFVPCVLPPLPTSIDAISQMLRRVRPRVVVCERHQELELTDPVRAAGFDGAIVSRPGPEDAGLVLPAFAGPGTPLFLQQSSGTTGAQKALVLDDRRVLSQVWQIAHAVGCVPGDRVATWLPMYHDMGFVCTLVLPLALSLPTVVISPFDWVARPDLVLREISAERASITWMPNFALAHAARRTDEGALAGLDLSSLRVLVNGGEPVTQGAITQFLRRFGPYGLRASALTTGYGAAEATAAITQSPPGRSARCVKVDARLFEEHGEVCLAPGHAPRDEVREIVSSGRTLSHTRIHIVDPRGDTLGDGRVGEIVVAGDAVASTYESDREATATAFRGGEFHTGDLGFRFEDEIFVTGRKDDLIVVAGRKVQPHCLEDTAYSVEGVSPGRVVVFGVPAEAESTQKLVLLAEARSDVVTATQEAQLAAAVTARVFDEWRLPVTVAIVTRGTLIKTTSGKPSRSRNRALYLEQLRAPHAAR